MKYGIYNLKTRKFEKNPFDNSKNNTLVFEYPIQAERFIENRYNLKEFVIKELR